MPRRTVFDETYLLGLIGRINRDLQLAGIPYKNKIFQRKQTKYI